MAWGVPCGFPMACPCVASDSLTWLRGMAPARMTLLLSQTGGELHGTGVRGPIVRYPVPRHMGLPVRTAALGRSPSLRVRPFHGRPTVDGPGLGILTASHRWGRQVDVM